MALRTDYKDDILDTSVNEKRVYNLIDQSGNVVMSGLSLEDVTVYSQVGDEFGATEINEANSELNWKIPYNISPDFNFSDGSIPIGSAYISSSEQMSATGSPESGYSLTFGQSTTRNATLFISIKKNIPSAYIRTHKHKSFYIVPTYIELTGTLGAGTTSITLTDNAITTDSKFDFYTSIFGVNPTAVTVSNGSITLTFDAQETNMNVEVRAS